MTEQQALNAIRIGATEAYAKPDSALSPVELCRYALAAHAMLTAMAKSSGWPRNAILRTAAGIVTQARKKFIPNCG